MLITPTIRPLAPFAHLSGRTVTTRPSRALRRRLRTPEVLTISQWAERYRRVTEIDSKPGRWRNELVPHAGPIMDDIGKPWVRQVWICLPERGAKTQILLNTVCWGIDQGSAAGNIFWLMPTEADARKAMGERVIPVFRAVDDHNRPGRIARYLSGTADDTSRGSIRFNHGIRLFPAWANSPGSMASYFGRINIADECDKFPERTSEGSDPITLFLKRARDDRHRSKYVFASTPAGRFIHKGTMACQQVKTWALRCPDCGEYVTPGEEHLVIQDTPPILGGVGQAGGGTLTITTPQPPPKIGGGAAIACPACGTLWDEEARASAYHGGRQQILKGADVPRPETIGWHIPAWFFPIIPLTEIAAAKLRAESGDHAARVAWANGYRVEDHVEEVATAPELTGLIERREEYAPVVPMDACLLTAGCDVQADRLEIEVVAWGEGAQSWGTEYAVLYGDTSLPEVWDQLDTFLLKTYRHESGEQLPIARTFVDDGFRTHMVVRFTGPRLGRGVFAAKGASDHRAPEVRGPNQAKVGGAKVRQFLLGTQRLKSNLFGYFGLANPGPGYCHLPTTYGEKWFAMLQSEHLITKKVGQHDVSLWEKVKPNARNEAIDCRAYALAAFLSLRVDLKGMVQELKAKAKQETEKVVQREMPRRSTGGFVKGWKR